MEFHRSTPRDISRCTTPCADSSDSIQLHLDRTLLKQRLFILVVAPSPRILALLALRARMTTPTMAVVAVPEPPPMEQKQPFQEPPPVAVTPSDPWPRPYFLENGLRRVAPYHFTYTTYCKERWRGRGLLEIYESEFRDRPLEYYVGATPEGFGITY